MKYRVERHGKVLDVDVTALGDGAYEVTGANGERETLRIADASGATARVSSSRGDEVVLVSRAGSEIDAQRGRTRLRAQVTRLRPSAANEARGAAAGVLTSPMAGKVVRVHVAPGARVRAGDPLVVIDAMKMENQLKAAVGGVVQTVSVTAGEAVERGAPLVQLTPE